MNDLEFKKKLKKMTVCVLASPCGLFYSDSGRLFTRNLDKAKIFPDCKTVRLFGARNCLFELGFIVKEFTMELKNEFF